MGQFALPLLLAAGTAGGVAYAWHAADAARRDVEVADARLEAQLQTLVDAAGRAGDHGDDIAAARLYREALSAAEADGRPSAMLVAGQLRDTLAAMSRPAPPVVRIEPAPPPPEPAAAAIVVSHTTPAPAEDPLLREAADLLETDPAAAVRLLRTELDAAPARPTAEQAERFDRLGLALGTAVMAARGAGLPPDNGVLSDLAAANARLAELLGRPGESRFGLRWMPAAEADLAWRSLLAAESNLADRRDALESARWAARRAERPVGGSKLFVFPGTNSGETPSEAADRVRQAQDALAAAEGDFERAMAHYDAVQKPQFSAVIDPVLPPPSP